MLVDIGNLVEIGQYCSRVRGAGGRQSETSQYTTGRCQIHLTDTQSLLTPGDPDGVYDPNNVPGGEVQIITTITNPDEEVRQFTGRVESVEWKGAEVGDQLGLVTIHCVDAMNRLSQPEVSLTNPPQERTGARLNRILDAVNFPAALRHIDLGTATCAAITGEWKGKALQLIQQIQQTENGLLSVTHGTGLLRFREAGNQSAALVRVSDTPSTTDITPAKPPKLSEDPSALVSVVELTDAAGTIHREVNSDNVARFGERTLKFVSLSNAAATAALASDLLASLGRPRIWAQQLNVAAHFESSYSATRALQATIGNQIEFSFTPPGTNRNTENVYQIDHVRFDFQPLDTPSVRANLTWGLLPPPASTYWVLGHPTTGQLGISTRLAARPSNSVIHSTIPAGRKTWTDQETVTVDEFGAYLTTQQIPAYTTHNARQTGEQFPRDGQMCVILEDRTLRKYESAVAQWTILGTAT